MLCAACQRDNPTGARFCNGCGAPLPPACPSCGHANPHDAAFCNGCGARLTPAPTSMPPGAPRAYTPPHLAERILRTRSAIEGERKHVAVLFCDLADSTPVTERLGPEVMHELMDRCIRLILEQVHRYEGTVNQFLGDGVMALFGAPLALEDAPRRAVIAALAIQRALQPLARELRAGHGVDFRMRIGIHSGPVVVGKIGDDLRMDYTAVGDTTNLAARLEQLAEPGSILVSESTSRLVRSHVRLDAPQLLSVKGKSEPITAFRVLGLLPRRSLVLPGQRPAGRFVGREREVGALLSLLERAESGEGQAVGIVGEPGMGKSRLLLEFRQRLAGRQLTYLEGCCAT